MIPNSTCIAITLLKAITGYILFDDTNTENTFGESLYHIIMCSIKNNNNKNINDYLRKVSLRQRIDR